MVQETISLKCSENLLSEMPKRIGRWTIIEEIKGEDYAKYYKCICECGTEKIIHRSNLLSGRTRSCGCLRRELHHKNYQKVNKYSINEKDRSVTGKATNTDNEFIIDYEDYEKVKNISWYETNCGYIAHKNRNRKVVLLHRLVTGAPDGMVVDHINHNTLDNRKNNLRICTQKENALNRNILPRGISIIKRKNNRKYYVVQLNGKYYGCFKDYDKAKATRDEIIEKEYLPLRS